MYIKCAQSAQTKWAPPPWHRWQHLCIDETCHKTYFICEICCTKGTAHDCLSHTLSGTMYAHMWSRKLLRNAESENITSKLNLSRITHTHTHAAMECWVHENALPKNDLFPAKLLSEHTHTHTPLYCQLNSAVITATIIVRHSTLCLCVRTVKFNNRLRILIIDVICRRIFTRSNWKIQSYIVLTPPNWCLSFSG